MRVFFAALPWALVTTAGCATSVRLEEEVSRLRRDLYQTKKELVDASARVAKLESRMTLLSLGADGRALPVSAQAGSGGRLHPTGLKATKKTPQAQSQRGPARALPVVRLRRAPETQNSDGFVGAADNGGPPVLIKLGPTTPSLPVDRKVLQKPDPVLGTKKAAPPKPGEAEVRLEYEKALRIYREEARPTEAALLFGAFLARHPSSKFRDNAMYWLAECQQALGATKIAIEGWTSLVKKFPRSSKVPDALLRTGEVLLDMGNTAEAHVALKKVVDAYPKTDAALRARKLLANALPQQKGIN